MRQPLLIGSVGLLVVVGVVQMGQGGWIFLKAEFAQFLLHRAWVKTLQGEHRVKPWPWADTWPVAKLLVPNYGVDLIVLEGANGRTLAFGPGHLPASGFPGQGGTMILTGHRDTHFRFLSRLRFGDELLLEAAGIGHFRYRVREIAVVRAQDARLLTEADENTLVMITCYPFDALTPGGPLRYVVVAEEEVEQAVGSSDKGGVRDVL